jgi:hypothetical protein
MEGQQYALSGTVAGFDMKSNLNHRVEVTAIPSTSGASAGMSGDAHAGMAGGQSSPQSNAGQNSSNAGQSAAGQSNPSSYSSPSSQANASAGMSSEANLQTITVKTARSLSDRCSVE